MHVLTRSCAAVPAGAFFGNWLSVLLTMFVAQSLGLLIGALITNMKTALSLTTVTMLTIMLVAGFYVHNIPVRGNPLICSFSRVVSAWLTGLYPWTG